MAAGRGTRLKPFTNKLPKALLKVNNTELINYGLRKLRNKIKNIHVTVGYKGEILSKYLLNKNINTLINTNNKLNSWWIFNSLMKNLNEPVFVLTCDNVTSINLIELIKDYNDQKKPACMLICVKPVSGLDGDYVHSSSENKNDVNFISRKIKSDIYCSGIQIINPYKINNMCKKNSNFYKIWEQLKKKKQIKISNIRPKKWFSIDSKSNLNKFLFDANNK